MVSITQQVRNVSERRTQETATNEDERYTLDDGESSLYIGRPLDIALYRRRRGPSTQVRK